MMKFIISVVFGAMAAFALVTLWQVNVIDIGFVRFLGGWTIAIVLLDLNEYITSKLLS